MIGYKFGGNNAGIIGCLQAWEKLLGTKMAECNEIICQALNKWWI